jgi:glycosyltransferase involved in cell wall biosynthesis
VTKVASGPNSVSVIIPFFNTPGPFLRKAVESALQQADVNREILLVDDGSTPEMASVAIGLAESSKGNVRYLCHPGRINRGISATRNLGVTASTGDFVAFLDSDDVWLPGKLAEQVETLKDLPDVALVFGQSEYWFGWQPELRAGRRDFIPDRGARVRRILHPPRFVSDFLRGRIVVPNPSNFMVRRSAYAACGGFEESFPGMYEDQAFLAKIGLANDVCVVPRCWDRYRQHSGSVSAEARGQDWEETSRRRFLLWLRQYCRDRANDWPEVSEAISKELWLSRSGGLNRKGSPRYWVRFGKKWCLRVEEAVIPEKIRQLWWCRENQPKDQGRR